MENSLAKRVAHARRPAGSGGLTATRERTRGRSETDSGYSEGKSGISLLERLLGLRNRAHAAAAQAAGS